MEESERIPADIREIAMKVWLAAGSAAASSDNGRHGYDVIARALLAERERCAKIAENFDAWPQEGADIAAAIRA